MIILKDDLERYVPATIEPTGFVFEKLSDAISQATRTVIDFFVGRTTETMLDGNDAVVSLIKRAVSLKAFYDTIPSLDIVLTANGFGVVNGQNVVPASKDRVEKLSDSVFRDYQNTIDTIVCTLYEHPTLGEQWRSEMAEKVIKHILWRVDDYQMATGRFQATRSDLVKDFPTLSLTDKIVAKYISKNYLNELLHKIRTDSLLDKDNVIVVVLHEVYGLALNKQPYKTVLEDIVNVFDAEPELYDTYRNSPEFEARNTKGYENGKCDSTYFF